MRKPSFTPGTVYSMEDLGPYLRQRRKQRGYTQEQVALGIGMSPRLIGEMERGRGTVGFDRVITYANNLGIDLVVKPRGE